MVKGIYRGPAKPDSEMFKMPIMIGPVKFYENTINNMISDKEKAIKYLKGIRTPHID